MIGIEDVHCRCGNHARYINARGELCCSLCPLRDGIDSIRLADVPKLLAWARKRVRGLDSPGAPTEHALSELRDIIQRGPDE